MRTLMYFIVFIIVILISSCNAPKKDYYSEYKDSILSIPDSVIKKRNDSIRQSNIDRGYSNPTPSKGGKEAAIKAILLESKVTDAVITDANVLYASVKDDGSRMDGYASYLCEVLGDFNTSVKRVKIVRTNSFNDPGADSAYGVLLGECWCK